MNSECSQPSERLQQNNYDCFLQAPSIDQIDSYDQKQLNLIENDNIESPFESEEKRYLHEKQPNQTQTKQNLDNYQDYQKDIEEIKQYQTQNLHLQFLQKANLIENSRDSNFNKFSNSFDDGRNSFDYYPQRTSKSSTRISKRGQIRANTSHQLPAAIIQGNDKGVLTTTQICQKQDAFTNYMKQKQNLQRQNSNTYQQKILNQIKRGSNTSFDVNQKQDLSNRSGILTPGTQQFISNSFVVNQYFQGNKIQNCNKPITHHTAILSAGSSINPRNGNPTLNQTTVDPYAYLRWQQQKYKSCRSMLYNKINQQNNNNSYSKQTPQNNVYSNLEKQGNKTQKNCLSSCSSNGSHYNTSSTTIPGAIKSLREVKNPQFFISFRFNDRKVVQINEIGLFKNLTELDISGNLLQNEIVELKQLSFLKKLNLQNNGIQQMYQVPSTLEILNLSNNQILELDSSVLQQLKNLTTLDLSNNKIKSLEGVEHLKRMKRLLCSNNQIKDLSQLEDLSTLVELDIENNQVENLIQLALIMKNKKDILVVNLRQNPFISNIQTYDQLVQCYSDLIDKESVDILESKLKYYQNGCLFRSKRVYSKVRVALQNSKRSHSNASNEDSNSQQVAFSPLIGNLSSTPNNKQQRSEDIEQMFDEILDEEEELERKINKMKKRKQKKQDKEQGKTNNVDEGYQEEEEDDSFDDFEHSSEDESSELLSYRNLQHENQILNESTADFNKEIRQINEELQNEKDPLMESFHSLQSTQTLNQNKKSHIFKLDLSKCKNDQDQENYELDDVNNFDIPGLQFVKVTDDSFRQQDKVQHSKRSQNTQRETTTTVASKPPQKQQLVIPKLQLGALQKKQDVQQSIQQLQDSSKRKITELVDKQVASKQQNGEKTTNLNIKSSQRKSLKCMNEDCCKATQELIQLKQDYQQNLIKSKTENEQLKSYLDKIKLVINFNGKYEEIPQQIKESYSQLESKLQDLTQSLNVMKEYQNKNEQIHIKELSNYQNIIDEQKKDLENKDSSMQSNMDQLQAQLQQLSEQNHLLQQQVLTQQSYKNAEEDYCNNNLKDLFYKENTDNHCKIESNEFEVLNLKKMKQQRCQHIKRPQSVAQVAKSKNQANRKNLGNTSTVMNEYGSISSFQFNQVENSMLSQTMNKKVGVYLEKMRERNSSLQEKLNLSLNGKSKKKKQFQLNLTHQQESEQASVISPQNNEILNSTNYVKYIQPGSTSSQKSFSSFIQVSNQENLNNEQQQYNDNAYQTEDKRSIVRKQKIMSQKLKLITSKNESSTCDYNFLINANDQHYNSTQSEGIGGSNRNDKINQLSFRKGAATLKNTFSNNIFNLANQKNM